MAIELIMVLPGLLILLLANYGEKHKKYRFLTRLFLFLSIILVIAIGLLMFSSGAVAEEHFKDYRGYSFGIALSAILSLLFLVQKVRTKMSRYIDIDPENLLHASALVFAVMLVGFSISTAVFADIFSLMEGVSLDMVSVIAQDIVFVLLAFFGVGFIIRRNFGETLKRLGLVMPSAKDALISVAFVVAIFFVVILSSLAAALLGFGPSFDGDQDPTLILLGEITIVSAIVYAIGAGISEEILFRGALQKRFGILLTTIIFAFVHIQYFDPVNFSTLLGIGLILGYERHITNTTSAVITHSLYDLVIFLIAALM